MYNPDRHELDEELASLGIRVFYSVKSGGACHLKARTVSVTIDSLKDDQNTSFVTKIDYYNLVAKVNS